MVFYLLFCSNVLQCMICYHHHVSHCHTNSLHVLSVRRFKYMYLWIFSYCIFLFIRRIMNKRWRCAMSTKGKPFFIFIYLCYIRLSCKWWTLSIKANQNTYNKAGKRFTSFVTTIFVFHILLGSLRFILELFSLSLSFSSLIFVLCRRQLPLSFRKVCACVCAHARDSDQ